jgi:hypothetical protein
MVLNAKLGRDTVVMTEADGCGKKHDTTNRSKGVRGIKLSYNVDNL